MRASDEFQTLLEHCPGLVFAIQVLNNEMPVDDSAEMNGNIYDRTPNTQYTGPQQKIMYRGIHFGSQHYDR